MRDTRDRSIGRDVVGTVDSLWLSAADRIDDAMLINDPETGERRAMSPGEPSGAFVGLARAATRRNKESWSFETACAAAGCSLSLGKPMTCRHPAVRGM